MKSPEEQSMRLNWLKAQLPKLERQKTQAEKTGKGRDARRCTAFIASFEREIKELENQDVE